MRNVRGRANDREILQKTADCELLLDGGRDGSQVNCMRWIISPRPREFDQKGEIGKNDTVRKMDS